MGFLDGKRAVVIGASGGIGLACTRLFLAEGARVAGSYRRKSAALEELSAREAALHTFSLDLTAAEEIAAQMKGAIDALGGIDILVNAAGITKPALFHAAKPEEWRAVLESNLMGAFHATQSVILPLMRAGGGSIIEISSVYAERGGAGQSSYCASKAALLGMTRALSVELAAKKIRVNAVAPGFIDTAMTQGFSEKQREQFLARIPMKRFGKSEEVAEICAFLASDKASYITGQVFTIDGGLSAC